MSCEPIRAAIRAAGDGEWAPDVLAHLATCEACVDAAIDQALKTRPPASAPASFAADATRAARLATRPRHPRSRALIAGLASAALAIIGPAIWMASVNIEQAAVPAAAFILACAEGLAIAAWTLQSDVVRSRPRSPV